MTPAQARAFHSVAVEGSFTLAARRLSVSQPSITMQVKQLEQLYHVELFHRSSRGVRLTPTGEGLFSILRRMFGSYQEAIAFLEETEGLRRGHLRIGSYGPYAVIQMLACFSMRYPAVEVSLTFGNSQELERRLSDYELDIGVFTRSDDHSGFYEVPYSSVPVIGIVPRLPQWETRSTIRVTELLQHDLICREPGSAARLAADRMLSECGARDHRTIEIGSREGVVTAVSEGLGSAIIFDEGYFPTGRLVKIRLEDFQASNPVCVICLAERQGAGAIREFLSIAEALAQPKTEEAG